MMITVPTVLILGAGASIPYGFPSGRKLLFEIADALQDSSSEFRTKLKDCGFEDGTMNEFETALRASMQPSVDAFLERRSEFIEIGKTAIAAKLIPYEKPEVLTRTSERMDWYEYLFGQLGTTVEQFYENKLTILTFNYDRSLEYFLLMALRNSYGVSISDAAKLLSAIPIVHMYGQLGLTDYSIKTGRPFKPEATTEAIKHAVHEMQIIHEGQASSPQFKAAHAAIEASHILCFLGFGYHPINLQRLDVQTHYHGSWLYGTAYNLKPFERKLVERNLRDVNASYHNIELGRESENCLDYIRSYPIFDMA